MIHESSVPFISNNAPALVLAPMEGVTDLPMRALMTERGGFSFCVSEFVRISQDVPSVRSFRENIPELQTGARTAAGTPVQVQLLGGDPGKLADSAVNAHLAGAAAIDLNFGCPAPLVNKHDGGACLLRHPDRIHSIVSRVRSALPKHVPLSAKLRLGWESVEDIHENAYQAARAGASWITIHARTKAQGYRPPVYWKHIGEVRNHLAIPVVANGDIWAAEDLMRCYEETGCIHFMLGRGAMANPSLPMQGDFFLKNETKENKYNAFINSPGEWLPLLERFSELCGPLTKNPNYVACRIKQWLSMASYKNQIEWVSPLKRASNLSEIFSLLREMSAVHGGEIA
ncbi:MAG: tRNA-dihydrouridine synthase family protein [Bdellovibrionota bacterium]